MSADNPTHELFCSHELTEYSGIVVGIGYFIISLLKIRLFFLCNSSYLGCINFFYFFAIPFRVDSWIIQPEVPLKFFGNVVKEMGLLEMEIKN